MSEITSAPCDFLDWDSKFFGFRIGRLRGNTLTESLMEQVEAWSSRNAIRCLYFLARADDAPTTQLARAHGFQLADVRVTFERRITETPMPVADSIRPARSDDMPVLEFMARTGFAETRFFYDTGFPRSRVEELYAVWIRRDFDEKDSIVLVGTSENDRHLGYISCRLSPGQKCARIGLIGVRGEARGQGVGQSLVKGVLNWAAERGAPRMKVVTQGRNIAGQRLYQRCGFLTRSVELWYHKWYPAVEVKK